MKWPLHGSNPQYLYEAAGLPFPKSLLDFSANINPLGPPAVLQKRWGDLFQGMGTYPDPHMASLKEKISQREGVEPGQILIGNGGAEIISLIGRLLSGKKVMIVEPAFSEYKKACLVNNCDVSYYRLSDGWEIHLDDLIGKLQGMDAVFLCNPNNPTGMYYKTSILLPLLKACKHENCFLIIDEAFYDFTAEYEPLVPFLKDFPQLILMRSMTKVFAIPGLRLGYLMADGGLIEKLSEFQPHWSVNSVALQAGEWCLEDENHIFKTIQFIQSERNVLFDFYQEHHFEVSNTAINFYLLRDIGLDDQYPLFEFLLKRGIVPRHTFNFTGLDGRWLRFAIRTSDENRRLMEAMQAWRSLNPLFL
ncbi:threonine-phosphate decarboxylase CobD [Niallia endozanthoxylica]|uniref:threonine-phosphate decarboxylase n=1 Tax=Niallia endozanthoxylica TaxID=2036016 RepID=A0A5J5HBZ7_9BACI|nr:threonine-phosphate decarboxylase CobD [Niallia endozanthoxylica]KAA9017082.1 threonine-phosphate decarboxylase [Niallia endozanthoxylica]